MHFFQRPRQRHNALVWIIELVRKDDDSLQQRNYSEAILYACQQTATDKATKASTLFITDVLSMQPFAIVHDGMEQNTLTHPTVLEQAGGQPQANHTPCHSI